MKKKTLMQTVLPLIAIAVTALCISFSTLFVKANAEPVFSIDNTAYSQILPKNSVLTYSEENKATLNGTDYDVSVLTTYPSGKTNLGETIVLSELGDYTVKYYFNDGTTEYWSDAQLFTVKNTTESLFSTSELVDVTANAIVPDYIRNADDGLSGYWGSEEGVKFKVNSEDAVIRYDGIIDMTKMDYANNFVEMLITPEVYDEAKGEGVVEFVSTNIIVRLRDALNPEVGIEYVIRQYSQNASPVSVRTIGSDRLLGYGFWYDSNMAGNSYLQSSFHGYNRNATKQYITHTTQPTGGASRHEASSIKLYYDQVKNISYALPLEINWVGDEDWEKSDFRDHPAYGSYVTRGWLAGRNHVDKGGEGLWDWKDERGEDFNGFPSGAAKLEIAFEGLGKGSGNLMLFSIGGQNINELQAEEYETKIYVDTGAKEGEELPSVIAGPNSVYPIFNAVGYNFIEGTLATPSVKVYYNEYGNEIPVKNGAFPVRKSGKYLIEYTVYPHEYYGVATSKIVTIEAKDFYDFDVDYIVNPLLKSNVLTGDKVNLYEGFLTLPESQAKYFTLSTDVFYNGKLVNQYNGDLTKYFVADKAGDYFVNYSYTDFGGAKTLIKAVKITATTPDAPVFIDLVLPEALLSGAKYEFPMPTVTNNASVTVKVNGTDYTNKEFVVPADDFTVTYTATANGKTSTMTKTIKVLDTKRFTVMNNTRVVNPYLADFVIAPNGYALEGYTTNSIPFYTTTSSEMLSFINAINLNFFKFTFYLGETNNNSSFQIVVTDSVNPLQKAVIKFVSDGNNLKIYNNDILLSTVAGKFNSNSEQFSFVMKDGLGDIYSGNDKLATLKEFANGFPFSGFESGKVFVDFGFNGVTGASTINVTNIAGQAFNCSLDRDRGDPNVYFDKELPSFKIAEISDSIVITLPHAYDVLNAIKEYKAVVTLPDKSEIVVTKANDNFELKFQDYGYGEYILEFFVTDYAGRTNSNTYKKFIVKDLSEPVITLSKDIASVVKVGDVLELPTATAHDIVGSDIKISVYYTFNLAYGKLGANNTLTFDKAGIYKIYYYAVGPNGNSSLMEIVVEAK